MSADSPSRRPTRSSLACAPCRYKHLRCDGNKPICDRCKLDAKECVYHPSRRRGNPGSKRSNVVPNSRKISVQIGLESQPAGMALTPAGSWSSQEDGIIHDDPLPLLIGLYYEHFHPAHPCVLPQSVLKDYILKLELQPLLLVMKYIGSLFEKSVASQPLFLEAQKAIHMIRTGQRSITGFDIQAFVIFAIANFWANERQVGVGLLDETVHLAVSLGMHHKEFATTNGGDDRVLEECWRRTWWQVYVTDAHIAGTTHTYPFRTSSVAVTADLPCEEEEYNSMNIPIPRSLDEYDNREFLPEEEAIFSSFAEMVGLTRGIGRALSSGNTSDPQLYKKFCAKCETSVTAWESLLPESKRALIRPDGSVDQLMYESYFTMHVYMIEIYRPLTSLRYSAIEAVSSCQPAPPTEKLNCSNAAERHVYTTKCRAAIEKVDNLLTLPVQIKYHTPFVICMIAIITIIHLSAYRFVFEGEKLETGRENIRLKMGTLKRISEYWSVGKQSYQEIGTIACKILSLKTVKTPSPDLLSPQAPPLPEFPLENLQPQIDISTMGTMPGPNFDFCSFFDNQPADTLIDMQGLFT